MCVDPIGHMSFGTEKCGAGMLLCPEFQQGGESCHTRIEPHDFALIALGYHLPLPASEIMLHVPIAEAIVGNCVGPEQLRLVAWLAGRRRCLHHA